MYDTVRWIFLDQGLSKMGCGVVGRRWIDSIVEMSILVNGPATQSFRMERGLRKGDTVLPFLIVLVTEFLSKLLDRATRRGIIEGLEVGKHKVVLSHLQFVDDTILFCPTTLDNLLNFRRILNVFGIMSGLQINYEKSALFPMKCEEG